MRRFFTENITLPTVQIEGEEARHILRVLRLAEGDSIILFDGSGMDYPCRILSTGANSLFCEVGEGFLSKKEPDARITLYQAVLKNDKMDWVLQKTVELGIAEFVPFISRRCVKRPDDAAKLKIKYEKTASEAAKQCGRSLLPVIHPLVGIEDIQKIISRHQITLLAYENEKQTIKSLLGSCSAMDIGIVIGPEGGFEAQEAAVLCAAGALSCSLGKLILRAETAAVAAVSMTLYEKMETL